MKSGVVALLVACLAGSGLSAPTLIQRDLAALQEWAKQNEGSALTARASRDGIDILTNMLTNILHGHAENSRSKRQDSALLDEVLSSQEEEDGRVPGGLTDTIDTLTGGEGEGPARHLTDTVDGLVANQEEENGGSLDDLTGPIGGLTGAIPGGPIRNTVNDALSNMVKRDMSPNTGMDEEMLQRRVVGTVLSVAQNLAKGMGILNGLGAGKRDVASAGMQADKRQLSGITNELGLSGNSPAGPPPVALSGPSHGINGVAGAGSNPSSTTAGFPGRFPDDMGSIPKDATSALEGFPPERHKPKKKESPLRAGLLHGSVLPGVLAVKRGSELEDMSKRGKPPGGLEGIKGGAPDLGLSDDLSGAITGGQGKDAKAFPGAIRPIADLLGLGKKAPEADFDSLGGMEGLTDAERPDGLDSSPSNMVRRGIPGDVAGLEAATSDLKKLPGIPDGLFGPSSHSNSAHKGNGFASPANTPSDLMARRVSSGTPGGVSGLDATDLKKLPGIPDGLFGSSSHKGDDEDDIFGTSSGSRSNFMARRRASGAPGGVEGLDAATGDLRDLPGIPEGLFGPDKHSSDADGEEESEDTHGSKNSASPKAKGGLGRVSGNMATPWRVMKKPSEVDE
ncbi:GTP1/OBG domain-containing protein [Purpureocillium lavendulum]|uniref:GTP1/OBG domain-containing protein n=1 Tax=Purpureocillium lavendulum TaxID=1247861 RepID=A0AB34G4E4_9HYPO|nr:GTP1/OBG domain-containing protein [Purpureocillium lavendulum]